MKKHDCFHFDDEPAKRERPEWAGSADTTPVGQYWDVQHKPCPPVPDCGYGMPPHKPCPPLPDCGYCMPPLMPPIPPFNPNLSMPGQVEALNCKVNDLIKTLNCYSENVYGAYNAIVQSALCNDAYYREVTIEEGYIPDVSAKYKVVHIPFLDKAGEPIYLELGLAYNNSTNSGVREKSFDASQRFLADKLIPAANVGTNWYGHPVWKNAPIPTTEVEGMKYTVGITEGGFIKWYANSVDDRTMQIDKVRNAMGVRSVLIAGGELSQNMWETTESTQLARVGIGMNYQTKERFIVVVEGSDRTGCTVEQFANIFKGYACDVAVECANGDSSYMVDKGEMAVMPSTVNAMSIPTVPDSNCFWYITKRRHYKNQYVKDVATLTQRVGQEIWNSELADTAVDKVKAEVVDLNNRLEAEIQNREAGDEELQRNLDKETEARVQSDAEIYAKIKAEVTTLNERIDSEVEKLNAVDAKLREDLTAETQNRIANDIASVELVQDGTKDIYRLKKNDGTAIEVPIEVYNYTLLVQKLDTLSQVEVRLNAEIEARKTADDKIEAKVDTEIADRKTADADLQKQINDNKSSMDAALAQEVADRKAADAQETADRTQADADMDTALKALIKAEETARTAQDTVLANQIADLTKQYKDFKNATESDIAGIEADIEGLNTNLDNLVRIVSSNKAELEGKLTDLTARVTAEETTTADNVQKIAQITSQLNVLQETMSALNQTVTSLQASFASTEKSFENVKQTVSAMQEELNTFEATVNTKLAELEGKFGDYLPLAGGTMSGTIVYPPNPDMVVLSTTLPSGKVMELIKVGKITFPYGELGTMYSPYGGGSGDSIKSGTISYTAMYDAIHEDEYNPYYIQFLNLTEMGVPALDYAKPRLSIGEGVLDDDAVTKKQLDTAVADVNPSGKYLPLAGGTMSGDIMIPNHDIIMGETTIDTCYLSKSGLFNGSVNNADGITFTHVSDENDTVEMYPSYYDTSTGQHRACLKVENDEGTLIPIKAGDAVTSTQVVTKQQLDAGLARYLPLSGGTMSGVISNAVISTSPDGDINNGGLNNYTLVLRKKQTGSVYHINMADDDLLSLNNGSGRLIVAGATAPNEAVNKNQLDEAVANVIGTYYNKIYHANLEDSLPAHKRIVFASHLINIDSSSALYGKTVISVLARFINNGDVMNSVDINTMVLTDPNGAGAQILLSFNAENLTDNDITRGSGSDTYIEFTIRYK